ncbi:MAG: 40S ribosomal protein S3 [Amphiamblys sp. WSBS2006]|nr:MAG: 40S ribosomal protein S3 [Amphiamblys sp. WSBS2006]
MHNEEDMKLINDVVADGIFHAEIDAMLSRALENTGYAGVEIRDTTKGYEMVIHCARADEAVGEQGKGIKELKLLIQQRYGIKPSELDMFVTRVEKRGLSAPIQCEGLKQKLLAGLPVRRACNGTMRFIMEAGAAGCQVIVSGKIRGQRARSMKFTEGHMIHAGQPGKDFVERTVKHVLLRQGVLGIKIKIMKKPESLDSGLVMPDRVIVYDGKKIDENIPEGIPRTVCYVKRED